MAKITKYIQKVKNKSIKSYAKTKILSENYIKKIKKYLTIRTNFFGRGNKFKKSISDRIKSSLKIKNKII